MKCQECGQPAIIHVTEARKMAAVSERHLCEAHARQYLQDHPAGAEPVAATAAAQASSGQGAEVRMDLIRLVISEVHDQQLMILGEVSGRRCLSVVIGIFKATSLDRRLKQLPSPRPLTHDAWADTIGTLGGRVQDVLIHDLREHTYYVWVRIRQGEHVVAVDVRPSDALVLAVLLQVPVLIAGWLLEEVSGPAQ
jgi:bifunctional DNase/RNase